MRTSLPPAAAFVFLSPYVTATCCGHHASSRKVKHALHPTWYQTLRIPVDVLPVHWRPEIILDFFSSRLGASPQFGRLSLPLSSAFAGTGRPPPPTWHTVSLLTTKGSTEQVGRFAIPEVLVSLQLLPKDLSSSVVPKPLPIVPDTKPAYVEVTLIGLRNLVPRMLGLLQKAQVVRVLCRWCV